jgi:hypothetical protein
VTPPQTASTLPQSGCAHDLPWRLEEVDFAKLEAERVRHDHTLFFLLVTSSFVEAASDLYARNLSAYYAADADIADWLKGHWEQEEMQHGRALRAYIRAVWPEFDWERANANFFTEYSAMCTLDEFEPTRGLEMAARCVVETGTSSLYRAIHNYADEPLLKELIRYVMKDESRHVAFGMLSLSDYYGDMKASDVRDREDFIIYACELMRNRLVGDQIATAMGWDREEVRQTVLASPPAMMFRRMIFARVVPNLKRLGLLTPRVRESFAGLGILEFEDADPEAQDRALGLT